MGDREGEVLIDVHHPLDDYHRRLLSGSGSSHYHHNNYHTTIEAYVSSSSSSGWSTTTNNNTINSINSSCATEGDAPAPNGSSFLMAPRAGSSKPNGPLTQRLNNNNNQQGSATLLVPSPHFYSSAHHMHQYAKQQQQQQQQHTNTTIPATTSTQHHYSQGGGSLLTRSPRSSSALSLVDLNSGESNDDFEPPFFLSSPSSTSSREHAILTTPTTLSNNDNDNYDLPLLANDSSSPTSSSSNCIPSNSSSGSSSYHHRFAYSIYLFISMSRAQIMKQKQVFSVVMLTLLCLSFTALAYMSRHHLGYFLEWVRSIGLWGNLLFIVVFTSVGFPFMLGYIPLTVGAGYLYGMVAGTITVSIGATSGAGITFLLCRTLTRKWVERHLASSSKFNLFMTEVENNAWKITLLTRLLPFPFGLVNGLFALSSISFPVFIIGTAIGLLPFQLMWTYFGTTLRSITEAVNGEMPFGIWQQFLLVLQIGLGIGLCLYMYQLSQAAMRNSEARAAATAGNKSNSDLATVAPSSVGGGENVSNSDNGESSVDTNGNRSSSGMTDIERGSDLGLSTNDDGHEEDCDHSGCGQVCEVEEMEEDELEGGSVGVGVGVDVDVDLEVGLEGCKTARGLVHAHTHTISLMDDDDSGLLSDDVDDLADGGSNGHNSGNNHTTSSAHNNAGRSLVAVAHETLYSFVVEASHNWLGVSVKGGGLKKQSNTHRSTHHATTRHHVNNNTTPTRQTTTPHHYSNYTPHNTSRFGSNSFNSNNKRVAHSFKKGPRARCSFSKATVTQQQPTLLASPLTHQQQQQRSAYLNV
eukprot:TRINITY_DN1052_c0_g1_i1.p1 TRINITY_DN1052_c0_g1~~TRINITY_DN1052_c0_g1_i1.p1  ORF type:complete len:807 (-),score=191.88 TRINITY_DN1052_c0_g1_i1:93-2513(-)